MKLSDIVGAVTDEAKKIEILKSGRTVLPKIDVIKKQYDVSRHDVMDKSIRQDKQVKDGENTKIVPVNRIAIPFQPRIAKTSVAFAFGNNVKWSTPNREDNLVKLFESIKTVFDGAKISTLDRLMCYNLKKFTECAEYWYSASVDTNEDYGFSTDKKIKGILFTPDKNTLYPYFDEFGDMVAFSREYVITKNGNTTTYFETYTSEDITKWVGGLLIETRPNTLKKIPVVYINQELTDWQEVETAINRLETLLSNFADCVDYHGSPTIVVTGELQGFADKGEQGKLLVAEKGGEVKYLSWEQAPDAVKLEIDTLFDVIYTFTQTPNISFSSVKGISSISGIALKLLFMDAHLKVMADRVIYDAWMDRRASIVKSYLSILSSNKDFEKLKLQHEIRPYMIEDLATLVSELTNANGGNAIISQQTSIGLSGLVDDAKAEYEKIVEEDNKRNTINAFPPAV